MGGCRCQWRRWGSPCKSVKKCARGGKDPRLLQAARAAFVLGLAQHVGSQGPTAWAFFGLEVAAVHRCGARSGGGLTSVFMEIVAGCPPGVDSKISSPDAAPPPAALRPSPV
ncbi:unnamed protein product [Ostreobium quekettii]|uniref:Uncharacterized protein n=1 Tax=Ostreobium quekettii TaxID=121088 RepID=A0A8S1J856_9CHLO|nr:unnamed protein product [Ostreobium quekettii]